MDDLPRSVISHDKEYPIETTQEKHTLMEFAKKGENTEKFQISGKFVLLIVIGKYYTIRRIT